eukprot:SAG11_NODE_11871_length_734_cov_0.811024_1_plen_143_part_00
MLPTQQKIPFRNRFGTVSKPFRNRFETAAPDAISSDTAALMCRICVRGRDVVSLGCEGEPAWFERLDLAEHRYTVRAREGGEPPRSKWVSAVEGDECHFATLEQRAGKTLHIVRCDGRWAQVLWRGSNFKATTSNERSQTQL